MTNHSTNGKKPVILYLLGILQVMLLMFATYWTGRIEGLDGAIDDHEKRSAEIVVEFEKRMAILESEYKAIREQLERIEKSVEAVREIHVNGNHPPVR